MCSTQTANVERILAAFMRGEGEYENVCDEAGAVVVSVRKTTALQDVTDRGDRHDLIGINQRSLNIDDSYRAESTARRGEVFPPWAIYTSVGILSFTVSLLFFMFVCLLSWMMQSPV